MGKHPECYREMIAHMLQQPSTCHGAARKIIDTETEIGVMCQQCGDAYLLKRVPGSRKYSLKVEKRKIVP
ncbi:MAG: hypothetical protein WC808_04730 [Patescibacteria group bacterium]